MAVPVVRSGTSTYSSGTGPVTPTHTGKTSIVVPSSLNLQAAISSPTTANGNLGNIVTVATSTTASTGESNHSTKYAQLYGAVSGMYQLINISYAFFLFSVSTVGGTAILASSLHQAKTRPKTIAARPKGPVSTSSKEYI